jgi:hypothetical protein
MVVIGAGTSTCPYLEEQSQSGNNFNYITLSPDTNQISIQRYKADGNGKFDPDGNLERYPVFKIEPYGYSAKRLRKSLDVNADGTVLGTYLREGIRVEQANKTIQNIEFEIAAEAPNAKILEVNYSKETAKIVFTHESPSFKRGRLEFKQPLTFGSKPVDLWYSFKIADGTALSREQVSTIYSDNREVESTTLVVKCSAEILEMEVNFPLNYEVHPEGWVEHLGSKVNDLAMEKDGLNRWSLRYSSPPIDHQFHVEWRLPLRWP